mmetsp:Transcript_851/g.2486  ORF Transcript_851/g.2486 Transcript_851/m.2486 type:complete len:405 (-) Transcript_851:512-1726(-)
MPDVILINSLNQTGGVMIRLFLVIIAAALHNNLPVEFGLVRTYGDHYNPFFDPHSFWDLRWLSADARNLTGSASIDGAAICRNLAPCFLKSATDLEPRMEGFLPETLLEEVGCKEDDGRFQRLSSVSFNGSGLGALRVVSFAVTGTDITCQVPVEWEIHCRMPNASGIYVSSNLDDPGADFRAYNLIRRKWDVKSHIKRLMKGLGVPVEDVLYFHLRNVNWTVKESSILFHNKGEADAPTVSKALRDFLRRHNLKCVFIPTHVNWRSAPVITELLELMGRQLCELTLPFEHHEIENNLFRMEVAARAGALITTPDTTYTDFALARRCLWHRSVAAQRPSFVMEGLSELEVKSLPCEDAAGREAIVKFKMQACWGRDRQPRSFAVWRNSSGFVSGSGGDSVVAGG